MKLTPDVLCKLPLSLRVEVEENALRKDLTQTELAAQQERILAALREHRKPGRRADLARTCGKDFPEGAHVTAAVGKLYGESRRQVEKRLAIFRAARDEPEKYGKLAADMDRSRRVDGTYRRYTAAIKSEAIRKEPPPLPGRGPYRVLVVDPPWRYEHRAQDMSSRAVTPYPTLTVDEICAIPVSSIAREDSILWLWATNAHLRDAFSVLDAWDFEQKSILTWAKLTIGVGDWLRGQTEHCLMAVRGKPRVDMTDQSTLLRAPTRGHSRKPDEFYTLVESLCPAPRYAELFSRHSRPNWDGHGDEYLGEERT